MNRRGLFRMLGLAPMAAVAAVLPQPAHGFSVGVLGPEYFVPGGLFGAGGDLPRLVDSLEGRIDKFDRSMLIASRFSVPAGEAVHVETHYWGA